MQIPGSDFLQCPGFPRSPTVDQQLLGALIRSAEAQGFLALGSDGQVCCRDVHLALSREVQEVIQVVREDKACGHAEVIGEAGDQFIIQPGRSFCTEKIAGVRLSGRDNQLSGMLNAGDLGGLFASEQK